MSGDNQTGRVTAAKLRALLERQGTKCRLSWYPLDAENVSIDWILPIARGGSQAMENVQLVREDINRLKGGETNDELDERARESHERRQRGFD